MTRPGPLSALLALLVAASPLSAQGRRRRHRPPPRAAASRPVDLRLLRTERASAASAALALPTMLPAVTRCIEQARAVDPASVATIRHVDVVVSLTLGGRATAVTFDPPLLARGLSACLGDALLTWRQSGVIHPRASVYLALELRPR